ncbi:MAG: arginine--tRNA ligase [Candidatus Microsaccharimonas sossegonensis]|uniref:Arginine--tRNA ligase n=1 Tax=Candidatus Microsaccharimonas sossegonensis TaxID=2506948 RepID=A0A4Q0AHE1_9BACT|nr:MAG: arginine--tRNA ligase [Candidatus Microsaccharimonas sossegonensis]
MENKISEEIKALFDVVISVQLTRPEPEFGDYAINSALQLAGRIGKDPREVANMIAARLRISGDFREVTVAGPGFINIRLSDSALQSELVKMEAADYGRSHAFDGKVVITEYSDPNPFKVLHAGHFYTSVIGDAISNLIEQAGGKVHRVNFGGDVGLHVAKTLWAIVQKLDGEHPEKLRDIPENQRSEWMAACYVEGTNAYEEDEQAQADIIALNKKVYQFHADNDHESALARIYWTCRDWSYDYFNAFYERIGTSFEKYYPESQTAPIGLKTVLEQKQNGVYEDSDGAIIFKGEPYGLHTRVFVNKEGLPTYEAKDVGLSIKKWEEYHFDTSIIITGNDITEYMKVVLKSIEQFEPELAKRTLHLTHGNVKLAGGLKMSSRKGNFLRAVDVLKAAADENEKTQGNRDDVPVLGAIKYSFLKNRIGPDVIFDPHESVGLHGNSGPYVQYAHARAVSIISKLSNDEENVARNHFDAGERSLVVKMSEFGEVIQTATEQFSPHLVCTYLYELAQIFNRFYEVSRIVDDPRQVLRGRLVRVYAGILKRGLGVLGIQAPDHM